MHHPFVLSPICDESQAATAGKLVRVMAHIALRS
jgi:hypothetical protein